MTVEKWKIYGPFSNRQIAGRNEQSWQGWKMLVEFERVDTKGKGALLLKIWVLGVGNRVLLKVGIVV